MDFMTQAGFFGTRAPMFMDIVSLIVLFLPFIMFGIILLARKKNYALHAKLQLVLYVVSVLLLTFFEIGVRNVGGFKAFMEGSSVAHNYALIVLVVHIMIAVTTLIIWTTTILRAKKHLETNKHKKFGYMTFMGVLMIVLTGMWVYMLLFVY